MGHANLHYDTELKHEFSAADGARAVYLPKSAMLSALADVDFTAGKDRNSALRMCQVCQCIVVVLHDNTGRSDSVRRAVGVCGQDDLEPAAEGCAAGGIDAELRLQPTDDHPLDPQTLELQLQIGLIESVRSRLLDDKLARFRSHFVMNAPAGRALHHGLIGRVAMLQIDDRDACRPGALQKIADGGKHLRAAIGARD